MRGLLAMIPLSLALSACEPTTAAIERSQYGERWPFTVDAGIISCVDGSIIFTHQSKNYAVNGMAINTKRYEKIDEIWADDPNTGAKKNLSEIINLGSTFCN